MNRDEFETRRIERLLDQVDEAREIIASFLLWHDPAYKTGPNDSLEKIISEANDFLWPRSPRQTEERSDTATAAGEDVSLTSQSTVSGEKE